MFMFPKKQIPTDVCRIIHREDFHRVLLDEATRLGAEIRLGAEVTDVVFEQPEVVLAGGERVAGDVIIGADGMPHEAILNVAN